MQKYLIIVAGGKGTRMDSDLPKQFIPLSGKPIILHAISMFHNYDPEIKTIVVLHPDYRGYWKRILADHNIGFTHILVDGGSERFHSVKNALDHIPDDCLVAVHDAVRPLVSVGTIRRAFEMAGIKGTAVPCIPIPESVRSIKSNGSKPVAREKLRIIQTPQVFRSDILTGSYRTEYESGFTDDATVVEHAGHPIYLVDGNMENIKITTRDDLDLAGFYMQQRIS